MHWTCTLPIVLSIVCTFTANAGAQSASDVGGSDCCRYKAECRKSARCTSMRGECVAAGEFDCARAEACIEDGNCYYNADEKKCDDGTRRADTPLFHGGLVVVGIGGATVVAGVLTFIASLDAGLGCRAGSPCGYDRLMIAYSVLLSTGAVVALGAGLPMAVWGGRRVPREQARISFAPGGIAVDF